MFNTLKKFGFFIVTVVLTIFIFWLVFMDKQSKTDALEYTLGLLGDKLVAMIPEESGSKNVKKKYDTFLKDARDKKVTPEQVEFVTANILNLANRDTTITQEQAEAVLNISLSAPLIVAEEAENEYEEIQFEKRELSDRWREAGERIKTLYEFNDQLNDTEAPEKNENPELRARIKYKVVDNKLIIAMDEEIRNQTHEKKVSKLKNELKKLEEEKIILWQDSLNIECDKEFNKSRQEYIIRLKKLKISELNVKEMINSLETLEHFIVLPPPPKMHADSLEKNLQKELQKECTDESGLKCNEEKH